MVSSQYYKIVVIFSAAVLQSPLYYVPVAVIVETVDSTLSCVMCPSTQISQPLTHLTNDSKNLPEFLRNRHPI